MLVKKKKKKLKANCHLDTTCKYNVVGHRCTSKALDQFQHLMVSGKGPRKLGKKRLSH